MGLHEKVACTVVVLMALGVFMPPPVEGQLCYYYISSIRSYSQAVRTYYYYRYYYSYSCGWWGWRRCYGSYTNYVYYYYYYTAYTVHYLQQTYCCWGYSGSNCDPICYNYCGHCASCASPYNCACDSGWTGGTCCSDYNECAYSNGGCEQNCHNTVGSYYCSCNSGYSQSGTHCVDINECNSNNGGCNQHCKNTIGGYYCDCDDGYYLSGLTCYDYNECTSGNGGCSQICNNQPGNYYCDCYEGYYLSSDNHYCIDNNECSNGDANCNHFCYNTGGSYYCYCKVGYELDIDDETCVDTNECASNNGGCDQNCFNQIASYYCTCNEGYTLDGDKHTCNDNNECALNTHLCDHNCFNNIGSYTCGCAIGYRLQDDGLTCLDIDECDDFESPENGGCDHTCVNEIGTYHCECDTGFLLDEDNHGCSDHDECATNVHDCDEIVGTCHNTHGTFYCTCPIGYRLNEDDQRTCDDINECDENSSGCTQVCNNIIGSYYCTCFIGFSLNDDIHSCSDIDECGTDTDNCGEFCHNLVGSYYCSCSAGYQLDSDDHTCVGIPCTQQLEAPDNGYIACTGAQVTGESCTFSCDLGYELMASQTRECQLTGQWTGVMPYCQVLYCEELKPPENGYITTIPCTTYFDSQCDISCVDGFYINAPEPHTRTCTVDDDNNVYWSTAFACEYIPPCSSNPCKHDGECVELSQTSYYCDCGDTLYTGLNCEIGVVNIVNFPILSIGEEFNFQISADPDNEVIVNIISSSSDLNISSTTVTLNTDQMYSLLSILSSVPGVYTLSYSVTGENADDYAALVPSVIIITDPDAGHVENQYFTSVNLPVGTLADGCCSPGAQFQCPTSTNVVSFTSTCAWDTEQQWQYSTKGVVFVNGQGISLPFSITGVDMTLTDDDFSFTLPDFTKQCRDCNNLDANCNYYDLSPDDFIDILSSRALGMTYLDNIENLIPDWLTFSIDAFTITSETTFGLSEFTTHVTTGENIYAISGCEQLDLDSESLFSVFSYGKNITADVSGMLYKYVPGVGDEPVCFAVNLCQGDESPVHITIPAATQSVITNFPKVKEYVNNDWWLNFHEALVSDHGIRFGDQDEHTSLADSYLTGDAWVDSDDFLPEFDLRLETDIVHNFYQQSNIGVRLEFSGDLYHQSSPSGSQAEGLLSGDLTLILNTTIEEKKAYMTLLTTSAAAPFTMPEYTSDSSAIPNGVSVNLNYLINDMDTAFKNIFSLPEGQDSCPVQAFISLTEDKTIDYVRLRTDCANLVVGGYILTGDLVHDIYISGESTPETPEPIIEGSTVSIFTYLGQQETLLNENFAIIQPDDGAAIICGFSATSNSMQAQIPNAQFSILGTTFTTAVNVNSEGFKFSNPSVSLYGSYSASFDAIIPLGDGSGSWDDFSFAVAGTFTDSGSSFVSNVRDYIYEYTDAVIDDAQERVSNAQNTLDDCTKSVDATSSTLAMKQEALDGLKQELANLESDVQTAQTNYDQAKDAYDLAVSDGNEDFLTAVALLKNICSTAMCDKECVASSMCSLWNVEDSEVLEWGTKELTVEEDRLVHSIIGVTSKRWAIEEFCQVLTVIKGWGNVGVGHRCSYIHTYDEGTDYILQAYYNSTQILKTEAVVTKTSDFSFTQKCCFENPCASEIDEYTCTYGNAACVIAQKVPFDSLEEASQALIQPYQNAQSAMNTLAMAKNTYAIQQAVVEAAQTEYDDLVAILTSLCDSVQSNVASVLAEEENLIAVAQAIADVDIETLITIDSITFGATFSESPNTLPITINYMIPGVSTSVTIHVEFTATWEIIGRAIGEAVLNDVGSNLFNNRRKKRQAVQPTYNEVQFQDKCARLNGAQKYLDQVYDSLQNAYDTSMVARANVTATIAQIEKALNTTPSEYSNIDFQLLESVYNYVITTDQLNAQLMNDPSVVNRTASLNKLKDSLWALLWSNDYYYFKIWQRDMRNIHDNRLIRSVGNEKCYGFADCLNLVHEIVEELLEDTPGTTAQGLLQTIPEARLALLSLSYDFNSTLTLSEALHSKTTGLYTIITEIFTMNYWCSEIPTITQHPKPDLAFHVGDTITIDCQADSLLPVTYSWEKDGFLLTTGQTSGTFTKTATELDKGQYQCFARNAVGSTQTKFANVVVYIAPVLTLSPVNYETYEGDDNGGFFASNATAYPEPSFEWYFSRDGNSWTLVENSGSNELIVPNPTKEDQGWYRSKVSASIGELYSEPAYLSILRASFSKLIYKVSFMMNITTYIPSEYSGSGNSDRPEPPTATTTLDYFRKQLDLKYTTIDNMHVDFNVDNTVIIVHIYMSTWYDYKTNTTFSEQAEIARMYREDLLTSLDELQTHLRSGTFWFEVEGNYYEGAHLSASVQDPVYECPSTQVLAYSNFLCLSCSPGTYYVESDGRAWCGECPKNTYTEEDGQTECVSCPVRTETLGTGSKWMSDCIDYCTPGYYSSNGLMPCTPCANLTYSLVYKTMECENCTSDDVGVIPECETLPVDAKPTKSQLLNVIVPSTVAGVVLIIIVLLIIGAIIIAAVVATRKRRPKSDTNTGLSEGAHNPLYVQPQDVLSLVPESERTGYNIRTKEKETSKEDDTDRDVVNPLFLETQNENQYEDMDRYENVPDDINRQPTVHDKLDRGGGGNVARKSAMFGGK